MTQAIDATGNVVTTNSNLVDTNEERTVTRDLTAEKIAKGHLNKGGTYIPDEVANNKVAAAGQVNPISKVVDDQPLGRTSTSADNIETVRKHTGIFASTLLEVLLLQHQRH